MGASKYMLIKVQKGVNLDRYSASTEYVCIISFQNCWIDSDFIHIIKKKNLCLEVTKSA